MKSNLLKQKIIAPLISYQLISVFLFTIKLSQTSPQNKRIFIMIIFKVVYDILSLTLFTKFFKSSLIMNRQLLILIGVINKCILAFLLILDHEEIWFYLVQTYIDTNSYIKLKVRQYSFFWFSCILQLVSILFRTLFLREESPILMLLMMLVLLMQMLPIGIYIKLSQKTQHYLITSEIENQIQQTKILKAHSKIYSHSPLPFADTPQIIMSRDDQCEENPSFQCIQCSNQDINMLMRTLKVSPEEKNQLIQSIRYMREEVWKKRMNAIPIGVAMLNKKQLNLVYENKSMKLLLKAITKMDSQENNLCALLDLFTFKIINLGNKSLKEFLSFQSQNGNEEYEKKSAKSQLKKSKSSIFSKKYSFMRIPDFQDPLNQQYTIREILQKLKNEELLEYTNDQDHTLELYSTLNNDLKDIHLNCRILNALDDSSENEITLIIQDYSHQHHLEKIEEQEMFKTKMISSFSHELRTPLNSAMLFIRTALMDNRMNNFIKDNYILPSLSSLKMQNYLINDIIDFSQISANLLEIRYSTFTLDDVIKEITQLFKFNLNFKKIGLAFNIDENVPNDIKSDYQRLLQIMTNLVQNAQKFSIQGYILIEITSEDLSELTFTIRDEGYGMSYIKLKEVQQIVNQQVKSNQDWKGFGLIISQMLLRLLSPDQKSNLTLNSEGFNRGFSASFTITNHLFSNNCDLASQSSGRFRIRKQSLPNLQENKGLKIVIKSGTKSSLILSRRKQKLSLENYGDKLSSLSEITRVKWNPKKYKLENLQFISSINQKLNKSINFQQKTNPNLQDHQPCKYRRILTVDDEAFNLVSLKMMMTTQGYEVDIAHNGLEAIQLLKEKKNQPCKYYELILMDCQMPIMNGWETTKQIRKMIASKELKFIPIIGLTAFTSSSDIKECYKAGMVDVLHKPLEIEQFKKCIHKLYENK